MSDLPELIEFPCRYPVKAMGRRQPGLEDLVVSLVNRHAELADAQSVRTKSSKAGNFMSVTIVINASSRDQLDNIYRDLTAREEILMVL